MSQKASHLYKKSVATQAKLVKSYDGSDSLHVADRED